MEASANPSCILDEPGEQEARSAELVPGDEMTRFFVVKKNGACYAYRNICPHAGAPLNWGVDKFLSYDNEFLVCSLHGATFNIETGYCFAGPGKGLSLEAVPFEIVDGKVIIKPG